MTKCVQGIINFYGKTKNFQEKLPNDLSNRLIITPSFDRYERQRKFANSYLFETSVEQLWNFSPTTHIILVQPYQRDLYIAEFCPRGFIVATMPHNEEGIGSARFWCTMIAWIFGYPQYFMLDDSYTAKTPIKYRPNGDTSKDVQDIDFTLYEGVIFVEHVFDSLDENAQDKIGILSLRRHGSIQSEPAVVRFCQGFVYVNVEATALNNNVFYRRGTLHAEDLLFSQACLEKRLFPVEIQHLRYYDLNTRAYCIGTSGAHSPNLSGSPGKPPTLIGNIKLNHVSDFCDYLLMKEGKAGVAASIETVDVLIEGMERLVVSKNSADEDKHESLSVVESPTVVPSMSSELNVDKTYDTYGKRTLHTIWSLPHGDMAFSSFPGDSEAEIARYIWLSQKNTDGFSPLEKQLVESPWFSEIMNDCSRFPRQDRLYHAMIVLLTKKTEDALHKDGHASSINEKPMAKEATENRRGSGGRETMLQTRFGFKQK
ncbi:MAG: hypothetical protein EOP48_16585 [Sphingobacteriales bacterium]|nr:MAG: hypothetical protein EOP48_16585 [Sphingobacteriales bacterium]